MGNHPIHSSLNSGMHALPCQQKQHVIDARCVTIVANTAPSHTFIVVHLRNDANPCESCSVFVELIFESVQYRGEFGRAQEGNGSFDHAYRQLSNVAFWVV